MPVVLPFTVIYSTRGLILPSRGGQNGESSYIDVCALRPCHWLLCCSVVSSKKLCRKGFNTHVSPQSGLMPVDHSNLHIKLVPASNVQLISRLQQLIIYVVHISSYVVRIGFGLTAHALR